MPNGSFQRMGNSRAPGTGEELELALVGDLAEVDGIGSEEGLHLLGEVAHLPGLAHLCRQQDPEAGLAGDLDGPVRSLVGGHPAQEDAVLAVGVALPSPTGKAEASRPWWITRAMGTSGRRAALSMGDGDDRARGAECRGRGRCSSSLKGPWMVVTTGRPAKRSE